jgi:hypothetical protein
MYKATETDVMEFFNCREADIDADGDIWIADPQKGHWLDRDERRRLRKWLAERGKA